MLDSHSGFSLHPDPDMRWIYDYHDPRYNSPEARDLRERRDRALRTAPRWMVEQAAINDAMREAKAKRTRHV